VQVSYRGMSTELLTQDAGTYLARPAAPRAFLVIHVETDGSSRVIDLPRETDVTFGRSRGATIVVEHEKVSRLHTRVRRTDNGIEVEDLGSRNGTRVNGELITKVTQVESGDEIAIGPILAVVGVTTGLRRSSAIVDATATESRLAAEIDRSVRYRRPLTVALVRISDDEAIEALAHAVRPMDLIGEDIGDDYLMLLPELDRTTGAAMLTRLFEVARISRTETKLASLCVPDDGTTVETVIARLRTQLRGGRERVATEPPLAGVGTIVHDPAMRRVYALVDRIADSNMTVLILGETGVGKELVTEAIHAKSSRRDQPLVKLNCAALPETLLESELFGYERGAFTGADKRKVGFFEAANGGTLFLDEIGDMPLSLQSKLLRVLERKVITRVGGTVEVPTDARVIAATHRDLDADVREGRFRQDLMYRIGGFTIAVPPLRDRPHEILPLAEHFARVAAAEQGRPAPSFGADARDALIAYGWPGNVRELRNAVERAIVLCGDEIQLADLPERLRDAGNRVRPVAIATSPNDVRGQLAEVERAAIVAALDAEGQNQTRAARKLGLSRRALIYKMEKYGLKEPPAR
jgi:two-component system, NtrC family, response regulator AtoC